MSKKTFFFVFFVLIVTNAVFSLDAETEAMGKDKKHTFYVNLYALVVGLVNSSGPGIGIGYDYNINQFLAVGLYGQFYSVFNDSNTTFDNIINVKYFPIKTALGSPYVNAGVGMRRNHKDGENFYGLIFPVYFGWKFVFRNGLVFDPALGVRYNAASFSGPNENGSFIFAQRASIGWTF